MPGATILEIPIAEQEEMLQELRRCRYGYFLALHILLLCAAGKSPTEIATFLFCSRSSIYRAVQAYRRGQWGWGLAADSSVSSCGVGSLSRLERSLRALLHSAPRFYGWCRTRWSCATLALTLSTRTPLPVSRETVRRKLGQIGYVWKRAKLRAKDDDPERARKLARIRDRIERLQPGERLFFADELDIHLLPKVGYQWMLEGTQIEMDTPGQNQKHYLAGALDVGSGAICHCLGERKTNGLFRQLLTRLDEQQGGQIKKIYVVVDNYKIHKAQAVQRWLEGHPRFELVFLPSYCPKANPIERAYGDVHDKCTRNHTRKRLPTLVRDVEAHLESNGPWKYQLSKIYYEPEVETALAQLRLEPAA
jgi:putative transposase